MKILNELYPLRLAVFSGLVLCGLGFALPVARAADVSFYGILKIQRFNQDRPAAAVLADSEDDSETHPFRFQTQVNLTEDGSVTNATLTIPGIGARNVPVNEPNDLRLREDFDRFTDVDAAYPNGNYSLTLQTVNDGTKTINNLSLTNNNYPAVPWITNYAILQLVTNTANVTVRWSPWTGGTANDYVELTILDDSGFDVYASPGFGETRQLTGQSNSVVIPANTLSAGTTYQAKLLFARLTKVDSSSYAGVTGVAGYIKQLEFTMATRGGTDDSSPSLDYATPGEGTYDVSRNSLIAFKFTERMAKAQSITWSGVSGANFSYTWNATTNILFCKYNTSLPADAVIGWTLNSDTFTDAAGNPLDSDVSGEFYTTADPPPSTDVTEFFLYKGKSYVQTNSIAQSDGGFQFGFTAEMTGFNAITNATLSSRVLTNALMLTLEPDTYGDALEGQAAYASQTDLDRFFVNTNYAVTLFTAHDGTKKVSLMLTNDAYPNAPTITNFSTLASVDSSNNFTLSWVKFTNGTTNDFIQLDLETDFGDEAYEWGSFTGTNTFAVIPVGTLFPGRTYHGKLRFIKIITLNTNAYAGVSMASVYTTFTEFELVTAGTPIVPQVGLSRPTNGVYTVTVIGEPGRLYYLESTEALSTNTAWSSLATQTLDETGKFSTEDAEEHAARFYRVQESLADFRSSRPSLSRVGQRALRSH